MTKFLNISTDVTLGGNSPADDVVCSQKAISEKISNINLGDLHNVSLNNPSGGQNLTYDADNQVWKNTSTSATVAWGGITGDITDQTDLQNVLNDKLDVADAYRPPLLSFQWSDHEISDIQWLRADTFSWQDGTVYSAVFDHLYDDLLNAGAESHNAIKLTADGELYYRYIPGDVSGEAHPYAFATLLSADVIIIYCDSITPSNGATCYNGPTSSATSVGTVYVGGGQHSFPKRVIETIAGINISYIPAQDGHKLVTEDQENNVAAIYAATGVAWYYIFDYTNTRFKLPRTKFGFTGLRDTAGKYVEPGLPNLTGNFYNKYNNTDILFGNQSYADGVFKLNVLGTHRVCTNSSGTVAGSGALGFDASRQNSIYGNSTTVQPAATQMYLYFYVGEFTQTAIQNTAGLNASLFNGKVDRDAQNFNSTGKAYLSGLGMPSDNYDDLTLGASGATYTAPANGWFTLNKLTSNTNQYGNLVNETTGMNTTNQQSTSGSNVRVYLPAKKGDVIKCSYSAGGTLQWFRFVYAKGEV